MESHDQFFEEKVVSLKTNVQSLIDDFIGTLQSFREDIIVLKKVVLQGSSLGSKAPSKIQVAKPKDFNGNWNAKELENYLWDMKQLFKAIHIPDGERVSITYMYLTSDVKLWWCIKVEDDAKFGRP